MAPSFPKASHTPRGSLPSTLPVGSTYTAPSLAPLNPFHLPFFSVHSSHTALKFPDHAKDTANVSRTPLLPPLSSSSLRPRWLHSCLHTEGDWLQDSLSTPAVGVPMRMAPTDSCLNTWSLCGETVSEGLESTALLGFVAEGRLWGFKRLLPVLMCSLTNVLSDQDVSSQLFLPSCIYFPITGSNYLRPEAQLNTFFLKFLRS